MDKLVTKKDSEMASLSYKSKLQRAKVNFN